MTDDGRKELLEFLRENLRIEITTNSVYTGGLDDGPLYSDVHTIQLLLDGEIISEATA